tara:strand:+ start:5032 stop:5313 length:282 start_codon:yes stop_codon:yes gene_type:complete
VLEPLLVELLVVAELAEGDRGRQCAEHDDGQEGGAAGAVDQAEGHEEHASEDEPGDVELVGLQVANERFVVHDVLLVVSSRGGTMPFPMFLPL